MLWDPGSCTDSLRAWRNHWNFNLTFAKCQSPEHVLSNGAPGSLRVQNIKQVKKAVSRLAVGHTDGWLTLESAC